jgi:hypothetical protein
MADRPAPQGIPPDSVLKATPTGLAEVIHAALIADDPYAHIEPMRFDERVAVDGHFDLVRVAKRILATVQT